MMNQKKKENRVDGEKAESCTATTAKRAGEKHRNPKLLGSVGISSIFLGGRRREKIGQGNKADGQGKVEEEKREERQASFCRLHTWPYRRLLFCGRIIMGDI